MSASGHTTIPGGWYCQTSLYVTSFLMSLVGLTTCTPASNQAFSPSSTVTGLAPLTGDWIGTCQGQSQRRVYIFDRLRFAAGTNGLGGTSTVGPLQHVSLVFPHLSFHMPGSSDTLVFEGRVTDTTISGQAKNLPGQTFACTFTRYPGFTPASSQTMRLPEDTGDGWPRSIPPVQGIASTLMDWVHRVAQDMGYVHSFLVVRHGHLASERYFAGYNVHTANNVKSVSKSFLSALVGIALREGYVMSLDEKIQKLLPHPYTRSLHKRKRDITLRQLLTMTSGLASTSGRFYSSWTHSDDWVSHALKRPLLADPGDRFIYSTGNSHLVSAAITHTAGMNTLAFAQRYLFQPLGIAVTAWKTDPKSYYRGGTDMYFTPRDMAKFGLLYLNNGSYDGK